jgi:hypothetical protein
LTPKGNNRIYELNSWQKIKNADQGMKVKIMKRYWVIAPYSSNNEEGFKESWSFDLKKDVIAISWWKLGDITRLSDSELIARIEKEYPDSHSQRIFKQYGTEAGRQFYAVSLYVLACQTFIIRFEILLYILSFYLHPNCIHFVSRKDYSCDLPPEN